MDLIAETECVAAAVAAHEISFEDGVRQLTANIQLTEKGTPHILTACRSALSDSIRARRLEEG